MVGDFLEVEESGATIEEAVERALLKFGCSRAEVETTIVKAPSSGFFGLFGARPAQVRIRLTDRPSIARVIAEHLLGLSGFSCTVDLQPGGKQINLDINGDQSSLIIGRHGRTLEALQALVVLLTDRCITDRTPIILDCDGYRVRRAASLRRLARRVANQVRRAGRSFTVQVLPPEERRILHLALKEENGIESRSIGQGLERKIVVCSLRD